MLLFTIAYLYLSGVFLFMMFIADIIDKTPGARSMEKWVFIILWPFVIPIASIWCLFKD